MDKPLYYLAHPYAGDKEKNILEALRIGLDLYYKGYSILSPLEIIPKVTDDEERAWHICRNMFNACDVLILSGHWENSKGCNIEKQWAKTREMKIYIYKEGELIPNV